MWGRRGSCRRAGKPQHGLAALSTDEAFAKRTLPMAWMMPSLWLLGRQAGSCEKMAVKSLFLGSCETVRVAWSDTRGVTLCFFNGSLLHTGVVSRLRALSEPAPPASTLFCARPALCVCWRPALLSRSGFSSAPLRRPRRSIARVRLRLRVPMSSSAMRIGIRLAVPSSNGPSRRSSLGRC